jgi:phytanoyl-CoA hydroxylase
MTATVRKCFRDAGFVRLGRIVTDLELDLLRALCDRVLEEWSGRARRFVSLAGEIPESLVTVVSPEAMAPELSKTQFARTARLTAAALCDCEPDNMLMGWRVFVKPLGGHGTPWHQDAAYRPPPHVGLSMFVPLDPVLSEATCMRYLPGSHAAGLQPHVFEHGHYIAREVDAGQPVLCPLASGEASIHHCLTLHATGPNEGKQPRRALAAVFQPRTAKG